MYRTFCNFYFIKLFKNILEFLFIVSLCIIILINPQVSASGAKTGLIFCTNILIPSLFPFMVLSSLIVKIGLSDKISKLLAPITKAIFNLPESSAATLILSFIGGYPTGAIGVKELFLQKKITSKQAEQMLLFMVCAGPAFILSAIGAQISSSKSTGIIIFISHIFSALILGIFSGLFYKDGTSCENKIIYQPIPFSTALVNSCLNAAMAMFNMCSFVILFSAFLNIIFKIFDFFYLQSSIIKVVASVLLEVTNGCIAIINNHASTELIAFALGWAGLCIHFQIFAITNSINFSKLKFIFCRAIHGVLSAIITHFLLIAFSARTSLDVIKLIYSSNLADGYVSKGSIAIIFLCIIFLFSVKFKNPRSDNFERNKKRKFKNFFQK